MKPVNQNPKIKKHKIAPKVPYYYKPAELTHEDWQIALRRQIAREQKFKLKNKGTQAVFSDFEVTNPETKKTYKVAIRAEQPGLNFCSCPDFATNTLGTCKHIEFTLHKLSKVKGYKKIIETGFSQEYSSVFLQYGPERKVVLRVGDTAKNSMENLAKKYFDSTNALRTESYAHVENFLEAAQKLDSDFRCYQDALDYILEKREQQKRQHQMDERFPKGIQSPLLDTLIKANLYPYQKEGILFAARAGRCLLADDMGLGKTIQAIATAELMAKEFHIEKVLVICPTSLKYQWKAEIEKFTERTASVIEGPWLKRQSQYPMDSFFKIISYPMVANDLALIQKQAFDLIILDEAQRIKNWKTATAKNVKQLNSPYAIVLTGTPLENRLEELHSLVDFVDRFKLGPLFRFLSNHQVLDEKSKVVGYKELNHIGKTLSEILLRRHKKDVLTQLPERIDKNFFVPMTDEQWGIHNDNKDMVAKLVSKWRRYKFLNEKDRKRLLMGLNCMRMSCDNTFIMDENSRHGPKLDELLLFLNEVLETPGEKVVIFSQWERMTRLVAEQLDANKIGYQYLHGGVPSVKRKDLLIHFREDPNCRIFLSTDAGGVGLNLQSASTVVNLDLPWNPAVLEQRIGRVHRLGQHKPVNVINFVSSGTIEEGMLSTLKFKQSIFNGVLDGGDNEVFMSESRFAKFMNTVATVTEETEKASTEHESATETKEETQSDEAAQASDIESTSTSGVTPTTPEKTVQDLFVSGIQFLEKLGSALQPSSGKSGNAPLLAELIQQDKDTGQTYLKLPVPDAETTRKISGLLESLLSVFKK